MVARGSCAGAAVGWEPGERNRRDDNICIIFNARTSGLRGGRQPPPADLLLLPHLCLLWSSLALSWSPSNPSLPPMASLTTAFLRRYPLTPLRIPFPRYSLTTPSNIPLKSIPPHCLLYLPKLIIRTQIYCMSLAARDISPELLGIYCAIRLLRFRNSLANVTRPI